MTKKLKHLNDQKVVFFCSNIKILILFFLVTTTADENQPPTIDDIHDIEQVKLIYETASKFLRIFFLRINIIKFFFRWSYKSCSCRNKKCSNSF